MKRPTKQLTLIAFFLALTCMLTACDKSGEKKVKEQPSNAPQPELEYALNEDGDSYSVIGIGKCNERKTINIPASYNGKPVTIIGDSAFAFSANLTAVTIPNSVTRIEYHAFGACENLTNITIPNSVTSIGFDAFIYCQKLIQIKSGVHYVGKWAIDCDQDVTNIKLSAGTVGIGEYAFDNCDNLVSITIPNTLKSIGSWSLYMCANLETITVDEHNPNYKSIDGNLYSKDGHTLIQYAIGKTNKTFTFPIGVTTIGNNAFSYSHNLTSIIFPNSIVTIGNGAFWGCDNLTEVTIPNHITTLGEGTFYGCTNLERVTLPDNLSVIGEMSFCDCSNLISIVIPSSVTCIDKLAFSWDCGLSIVYYASTKPAWNTIYIDGNNDNLASATVYYYSKTQPTTSGNYWHYIDGVPTPW